MYGVKLAILPFKDIDLCIHDEARSQNVHQLREILLKRDGKRQLIRKEQVGKKGAGNGERAMLSF